MFFFEKKEPKNFYPLAPQPMGKSFLLLFFKKEVLSIFV